MTSFNYLAAASLFSPSTALLAASISQTKKIADKLAADIALASTTATVTLTAHQARPAYSELTDDITLQLRRDGTRDGLRTHEDAEALYDSLPESINNISDVRAVVDSPNYEAGHIIPYAQGGSSDSSNIVYMPTELNREIGNSIPTSDDLNQAASAVEAEGYIFGDALADGVFGIAAGASAPAVFRLAGTGAKLAGGVLRSDPLAIHSATAEIPHQLTQGAQEGLTRGIPAAIGQAAFGPAGLVAGLVAPDFIEGAMTSDPSKQFACFARGSLKAGVCATAIAFPPLGFALGLGYLGSKLMGW